MTCRLDGQALPDVRQNGVVRTGFIRTENGLAPCQHCHMAKLCTALCQQQIVHPVGLVKVRSLRIVGSPLPEPVGLADGCPGGDIHFAEIDAAVCPQVIDLAVLVEEQGRVDSRKRQSDGVRPFPCRVFGSDDKVAVVVPGHIGDDHIEQPVMIPDGGCIDVQTVGCAGHQMHLRIPCQTVSDLLPMHQVTAVIDGESGEILKRAGHQIEVVSYPADAGVRVKSRQNGVLILHNLLRSARRRFFYPVYTVWFAQSKDSNGVGFMPTARIAQYSMAA